MAGAKSASRKSKSGTGRKVKDKWKAKEWYTIHAPQMFNEAVIGETPSSDPENLIGRTSEVTVQDLTGDFSKMHIKLKFKIKSVDGHELKTSFMGHEYTSDYVRRLTRRKKTKTDHVVDVTTSDGFKVRVKTMSIADKRIQSSQEVGMRQVLETALLTMAKEMTVAELIKSIISGDLGKDLARACRVVIPIRRIEIRRTEILEVGENEPESIIQEEAPAAEEAEPEEEPVSEDESETDDEEPEEEPVSEDESETDDEEPEAEDSSDESDTE
ncbi:MAG: 30S ribosomal protein S3ae [Euryarchaeota archaeon]|nr:30S ribosomal protein S3ae [Euryarchaeota archaeon]